MKIAKYKAVSAPLQVQSRGVMRHVVCHTELRTLVLLLLHYEQKRLKQWQYVLHLDWKCRIYSTHPENKSATSHYILPTVVFSTVVVYCYEHSQGGYAFSSEARGPLFF